MYFVKFSLYIQRYWAARGIFPENTATFRRPATSSLPTLWLEVVRSIRRGRARASCTKLYWDTSGNIHTGTLSKAFNLTEVHFAVCKKKWSVFLLWLLGTQAHNVIFFHIWKIFTPYLIIHGRGYIILIMRKI